MPLFLHSQEEENHLNFPLDESCDCDGCCPNGHCDCLGCDEPCDCEDEDFPTLGKEQKNYVVWVGGLELDHYMTREQAERAAQSWRDEGYDEVAIEGEEHG